MLKKIFRPFAKKYDDVVKEKERKEKERKEREREWRILGISIGRLFYDASKEIYRFRDSFEYPLMKEDSISVGNN